MQIIFKLIALIMITLNMQVTTAIAEAGDTETRKLASAGSAVLPPAYPEWPVHEMRVNVVPAPPLGPYMSTGLSGESRGFSCCEKKHSEQAYSPSFKNTPWPARRSPPRRWLPENGEYSYATDIPGQVQPGGYGNRELSQPQPTWHPMYQQPLQGRYW